MRCTRCDRIAVPPVLGRDPEGRLVFGWCRRCLEETGCEVVEGDLARLEAPGPGLRRRVRRIRKRVREVVAEARGYPWNSPSGRKLILLGVSLLLSVWSAVLAGVGAFRLLRPGVGEAAATGHGTAAVLLAGSGLLALVSLGLLMWLASPDQRSKVLLSVLQIATGTASMLALVMWVTGAIPGQWLPLAGASVVGFLISWWLGRVWKPRRKEGGRSVSSASKSEGGLS